MGQYFPQLPLTFVPGTHIPFKVDLYVVHGHDDDWDTDYPNGHGTSRLHKRLQPGISGMCAQRNKQSVCCE
ncbi:hypothetical protein SARC_15629 [Sphaeroforma arctica JP610]|uniref:Uncharacterized protein n=1 Tax=Sphaeroforma arctica JP610 TaxID=667725 RepID=A0A0L0F540_9EUKA|nr:hypothetical protein SARC_15629 [Sphaeroforma arctica JP610]KNC71827.1 hypothetical protein SARC_15629 [Sphaeroforma arctica JP610]|eukprot:XP_014145729.1 hypothetical protein SARC_15629 [Sphaeroforma arctica JP610]